MQAYFAGKRLDRDAVPVFHFHLVPIKVRFYVEQQVASLPWKRIPRFGHTGDYLTFIAAAAALLAEADANAAALEQELADQDRAQAAAQAFINAEEQLAAATVNLDNAEDILAAASEAVDNVASGS